MLKTKSIFVYIAFVASSTFMMYMIFSTDEDRPVNAASGAQAIEALARKKENEGGLNVNTLSGKVMINGKTAMPHGTVLVYGSGLARPIGFGAIQPDGNYIIDDLPAGKVLLVVTPKNINLDRNVKKGRNVHVLRKKPKDRSKLHPPGENDVSTSTERTGAPKQPTGLGMNDERSKRKRADQAAYDALQDEEKGGSVEVFEKIDRLYGSLSSPNLISTHVGEGQNTLNIELDTHAEPEVSTDTENP